MWPFKKKKLPKGSFAYGTGAGGEGKNAATILVVEIVVLLLVVAGILAALNYLGIFQIGKILKGSPVQFTNPIEKGRDLSKVKVSLPDKNTFPTTIPPNNPSKKTSTNSLSAKDVDTLIKNYLIGILKPSMFSTSDFSLKQEDVIKENFKTSWSAQQKQFSGNVTTSSNGKKIVISYISSPNSNDVSLSAVTAKDIVSPYFNTTPKGAWKCTSIYGVDYCENFWQESDGAKKGIGVQGIDSKQKIIFFCEHDKESQLYSWQSCINAFSKTGIQ